MKNIFLILLAILFMNPFSADAKSVKLGQKNGDAVSRSVDSSRGIFTRDTTGSSVVCNTHMDCAADQKCESHYCQALCRNGTDAIESLNGDPTPHCPDYPTTPTCYVDTATRSSYCGCSDDTCTPGSKCEVVSTRKQCKFCSKKTTGDSSSNSSVDTCGCPTGKYPNGTGLCVTCPNDYYCGANERCYSPGTVASKCVPLKCETGSVVDHNCQDCDVDKCIKCSADTSICEACKDGYHLTASNTCVQCPTDQYWDEGLKQCVHPEGCVEANQDDNDGTCLKCDFNCSTSECRTNSSPSQYGGSSVYGVGGGKGLGYGLYIDEATDRSDKKQKDAGYCIFCHTKKHDGFDTYHYLTIDGRCKLCNDGNSDNKCKTCGYSAETNMFMCSSCSTSGSAGAAVAFNEEQTKCVNITCENGTFYRDDVSYESTLSNEEPKKPGKGRTAAQLKTATCVPTCSSLAEDVTVQDSADCSAYETSSNHYYAIRQNDDIFKKSVNGYADMTCYKCNPISIPKCITAIEDSTGEVCTKCEVGYTAYSNGKKCGNVCTFTSCNDGFGKSAPSKTNVQQDTCTCSL